MGVWHRWAKRAGLACLTALGIAVGCNALVLLGGRYSSRQQSARADAILVLGAYVYERGGVCPMLADRLETGLDLYRRGVSGRFLLSGDHGQKEYDEVNAMRRFLEARGVPSEHLFLDHAGFDTYDSCYRAARVFGAHRVVIVTQSFHLPRALFIARSLGLSAQGVASDRREYFDEPYYQLRECAARIKAMAEVVVRRSPVHLGPTISLAGDGRETHDRPREPDDRPN